VDISLDASTTSHGSPFAPPIDPEADEPTTSEPTPPRKRWRGIRLGLAILAAALVVTVLFRGVGGDGTDAATNLLIPTPTPVPESVSDSEFLRAVETKAIPLSEAAPVSIEVPEGLHLFYGGRHPLQWVDLTTGDWEGIGVQVEPLVQVGEHLVLASEDHRLVGWLPLDSLSEMPQGWTASRTAVSSEPGKVWFFHLDESRWVHVDLVTGRVSDRRNAQGQNITSVLPWHPMSLVNSPDLISTADGVYEWDQNHYELVSSGRVLTTSEDLVLLQRCDPPDEPCSVAWFDRTTWDQVEQPTPTNPVQSTEVVGNGRWLLAADRDRAGFELLELATGRRVRFDSKVQSVAVSPDGELVAFIRSGEVHLAHLDRLNETGQRLAAFGEQANGRLHFVQMPDQ
jgi:hypothetical protein